MKVLVAFSGGKDSAACLIWAVKKWGLKNLEAVFCDTGWENEKTYAYMEEFTAALGVKLVILKSRKYDGFMDMVEKKGRFPSSQARFCTEALKTEPMIDYILTQTDNLIIVQGIRADESASRAKMSAECSYFKFYKQPYGHDKEGKPKMHSYRKKEVFAWLEKYDDSVFRPVFDWTGEQVMSYIYENGFKANPLYFQGAKRVGCYPCIMVNKKELTAIHENNPERLEFIAKEEERVKSTFFRPDYIPYHQLLTRDPKSGKMIATMRDVIKWLGNRSATEVMEFEDEGKEGHSCMSFYSICE